MNRKFNTAGRFFTMVELLFVISIIMVLISILLPALSKVKNYAAQISCYNNLRQVNFAINSYSDDNNDFIVPWRTDASTYWPVLTASYINVKCKPEYNTNPSPYMCPADKAPNYSFRLYLSYGINSTMGANMPGGYDPVRRGSVYNPSKTGLIMDMHNDSTYVADSSLDVLLSRVAQRHNKHFSVLYVAGNVDSTTAVKIHGSTLFWNGK